MKKEDLPTFEECEERIANNTASKLHIFIQAYEPLEDSDQFREQLADMLTENSESTERNVFEEGFALAVSACKYLSNSNKLVICYSTDESLQSDNTERTGKSLFSVAIMHLNSITNK